LSHVFISHAKEDSHIALQLAIGLEEAGYKTFCYEVDKITATDYIKQQNSAIDECKAVLLIISPHSVKSHEIFTEVRLSHGKHKAFIPLLRGLNYERFKKVRPEWLVQLGAAQSFEIDPENVQPAIDEVIKGLGKLEIYPENERDSKKINDISRLIVNLNHNRGISCRSLLYTLKSNIAGIVSFCQNNARWVLASAIVLIIAFIALVIINKCIIDKDLCDHIPQELVVQGEKFENNAFLSMESCGIPEKPEAVRFSWDLLNSGSYAGWTINLPPELAKIAVNRTYLVLSVQGQEGGEQFRIGLVDSEGHEGKVTVPPIQDGSRQISISLQEFERQGFALTKIQKLILAFEYDLSDKGSICIEQIGFCSQ
jgi:hypothetical protein